MKATSRFSPLASRLLLILLAFSPLTATAIIDADSDGMSDLWEALYGFSTTDNGTLTTSQAPNSDPDGDGVTNLNESIAGTSPLLADGINGLFRAKLSASTSIAGNLDLTWSQLTGKSYQPQKSLDLTSGSWLPFDGSATATVSGGKSLSFQPSGTRSFLRVQVSDVDQDGDTLSSWEEGLLNTNPSNPDTDGDGVDDNLELIYGSNPTISSDGGIPQPIPPAPAGELKVRLFVTTFLGSTYPSTDFLTPFSVKVFKKNVTTGVETLAHVLTYTGSPPSAVSIATLPNDGSIYTIQADLSALSSSSLVSGFKDFSFLISATPATGSAPFVAVNGFDPTTNTLGSIGHILGTPARIYNAAYTNYRAIIAPIILEKVISDQIAGNEANQLPTRAFGGQPNNPMVTGTRTGNEARFRIRADVWPTIAPKVLIAARDVAATTILGSTPIIPLPLLTDLIFTAADGSRLYEIVAGVDENGNGTLETGEVKTIFQKTPKVKTDGTPFTGSVAFLDKIRIVTVNDYGAARAATESYGGLTYSVFLPNAAKLISAFATGSKSIPGTSPTTFGNFITANGIGTPAALGLSLPLGATWNNSNEASTHLFDFPDGSDLSDRIKSSETLKLLIRRIISSHKSELLGFAQTGFWITHILFDVEDENVDFKEDGTVNDLALSFGKCRFRGNLEVEMNGATDSFAVRYIKLSGTFTDLYDFSWPGGAVKLAGVTIDVGNATKTQAGHATLTSVIHPDAGRVFYTRVQTLNVTKDFFGKF
jgi:hypothetical protein